MWGYIKLCVLVRGVRRSLTQLLRLDLPRYLPLPLFLYCVRLPRLRVANAKLPPSPQVGANLNYDEVVVYNEAAAIPSYLIVYSRSSHRARMAS